MSSVSELVVVYPSETSENNELYPTTQYEIFSGFK